MRTAATAETERQTLVTAEMVTAESAETAETESSAVTAETAAQMLSSVLDLLME